MSVIPWTISCQTLPPVQTTGTCVCLRVCVCVYVHHACMHVCVFACMYVCKYISIHNMKMCLQVVERHALQMARHEATVQEDPCIGPDAEPL